jgi:hypothetical protein
MFEHLGPLPYHRFKKKHWRHQFVLAFFFALGVFLFTIMTVPGPSTLALNNSPKVNFQSNTQEQRVSLGSPQLQLFQLTIDSPVAGLGFQKLKVYVNGLYDPSYLSRLKIFHQGVQLGSMIDFDEQGYLIFDLNDYKLPAGSSNLVITLPDSSAMETGTVMQFSVENRKDIEITYGSERLIPSGKFPLVGGVTQIVDRGDWQVYNRSQKSDFVAPSQGRALLGTIAVASGAEVLDIQSINFGVEQGKKQKNDNLEFLLMQDGVIVATAISSLDKISFIIDKPLATKNNTLLDLEIYAKDLAIGDYLFSLQNIIGKGYISNQIISWSGPMVLSRVHALLDYPIFESAKVDPKLQSAWNNVFSSTIKASSANDLNFYKLTWYYQAKNATIRGAKVFVDGQYYPMDVIIKDNSIIAKAEWSNPLPINSSGRQIQLMLDIAQASSGASVEVYLQPDIIAADPDNIWESNIVWSVGDNMKNSYLMPNLPLAPTILTNID